MNNVVKIPRTKTPPVIKTASRATVRAIHRQRVSAALVGTATVALIGLSMHDLATGFVIATGMGTVKSAAMAFGIDFGYVAAEIAKLFSRGDAARKIKWWANAVIGGTMAWSAVLNGAAWSADATGTWHYVAMALGASIPAMIFALSHIATTLWLDADR